MNGDKQATNSRNDNLNIVATMGSMNSEVRRETSERFLSTAQITQTNSHRLGKPYKQQKDSSANSDKLVIYVNQPILKAIKGRKSNPQNKNTT